MRELQEAFRVLLTAWLQVAHSNSYSLEPVVLCPNPVQLYNWSWWNFSSYGVMIKLRQEWGDFLTYSLFQIVRNVQMTAKVMCDQMQNAFEPHIYIYVICTKAKISMISVVLLGANVSVSKDPVNCSLFLVLLTLLQLTQWTFLLLPFNTGNNHSRKISLLHRWWPRDKSH